MTPREKAIELYNSFDRIIEENISATDGGGWDNCNIHGSDFSAKKCALISVDEIISLKNKLIDNEFWLSVRNELLRL